MSNFQPQMIRHLSESEKRAKKNYEALDKNVIVCETEHANLPVDIFTQHKILICCWQDRNRKNKSITSLETSQFCSSDTPIDPQ